MQKKYFRVELKNVDTDKIHNTKDFNYGKSLKDFRYYQHFLNSYLRAMHTNNISVDFFVLLNNEIYLKGNDFIQNLRNSIVDDEYIDVFKVTQNANHRNQTIPIKSVNEFIQSFDDSSFVFFNNGTYLWEVVSEFVRTNFSPTRPRRLSSIFLFDSLDSCRYYISTHLDGIGSIYEVELINTEAFFEADMRIIDNIENHILYIDLINEFADYWQGKMSKEPVKEIVFQGAYKYKSIV